MEYRKEESEVKRLFVEITKAFITILLIAIGLVSLVVLNPPKAFPMEIVHRSKFVTIHTEKKVVYETFLKRLYVDNTIVGYHISTLIKLIQVKLGLSPQNIGLRINIVDGLPNKLKAFYEPNGGVIFIDVNEVTPKILRHELAHAVIAHFSLYNRQPRPSVLVEESMCNSVE
jgi:hypothetical protein